MPTKNDLQKHFIDGPEGKLELAVYSLAQHMRDDMIAVVCHPLPTGGGSMDNKVVTTLARTFTNKCQIPSIRFNFRGVGRSEGSFDDGRGEQQDLLAVLDWVNATFPDRKLLLAGFSFGAYVSFEVAKKRDVFCHTMVAPPITNWDFNFETLSTMPRIILQGELDDVVPISVVESWAASLPEPKQYIAFPKTGHFFHGKLIDLRDQFAHALGNVLQA